MLINGDDESVNLLVRSSTEPNVRRYCVSVAKLPNGNTVNITGFGWHNPYITSPMVNGCNVTDLKNLLPNTFPLKTTIILYEHQCKMTEHAWNIESLFGKNISLMILTNRTNTNYELSYNKTAMPVSIPVLIFWINDFNKINKTYTNISNIEISMNYAPVIEKKFRPAVLLMFLLVLFILLCGNFWAADEFVRKIKHRHTNKENESESVNTSRTSNDNPDTISNNNPNIIAESKINKNTNLENKTPSNNEPAIIYMPYCIIALLLVFAVGWLLLIFYFPKVMIYILQAMFCIGAFSSLTSCFDRLSYFLPILRRYRTPSHTCHKPCTCQLGPFNVFTICAMIISLTIIIIWYIYRQAEWAWVLQDLLGAAICITVTSVYRLGNMRVITLILLGFFLYDIFFVFITPYIPFFQPSSPKNTSTITTTTTTTTTMSPYTVSNVQTVVGYRKVARNPSVMEQVALGIGTNGEVVPLLFALPMFIPESEIDPCMTIRKSMLGFGDVILPGILLTFCKIFDIASENRWPIYYVQSLVSYFIGLSLTHVALYVMNTAQPALLYLVPCILLSTIITGLCRGELKELFHGRRLQSLLDGKPKHVESSLLAASENSINEQTQQSTDVVVGISDAVGAVTGVENR
ncbi:unnamed protein product [Adineta steineri]|uniref:Signal peptide peptidase-like 2B n=1 Tax=Adineta steineri TaxID=433720 RepID=A0A818XLK1_9BILA|nr:unnamed protein product [Adineta steineri]CAF3740818.1 unnamed protein product [Adineta steineri]